MPIRMFVAVELPDALRDGLAGLSLPPGLRRTPVAQLHLTLCFLGEVPDESVSELRSALSALRPPTMTLALRGLGTFGKPGRPIVLWVGVDNPDGALAELHGRVHDVVHGIGLATDGKPFLPHVSLGRWKRVNAAKLRILLRNHRETGFGTFAGGGFTLFESILHPEGPEHVPLLEVPADGPRP